jgi:hypothetical protein
MGQKFFEFFGGYFEIVMARVLEMGGVIWNGDF